MGADPEKSRFTQKSFGVTNRIWLILILFLALILLSRTILPSDSTNLRHRLVYQDKPKNYLNLSEAGPNPFAFCPALGPGDELASKYNPVTLSKTRLHLGSGARIQRVINRALSGSPVTMSVIGGSVSACHGAGDDPLSPRCYPSRFFHWWSGVFPHPASELTNGAMRRTNSDYFSFCNAHHIPDVVDLVIIELDTDDTSDPKSLDNFELLIRSILVRPDQPAVLLLGHFSPQVQQANGFAGPAHWHSMVAQFYDVPHISTKPILYGDYVTQAGAISKYYVDPILANPAGHEVLADVIISYFQSQICIAWAAAVGQSPEALPEAVSPVLAENSKAKLPTDARGLFGGVAQRKGAAGGAAAPEPFILETEGDADSQPNPAPADGNLNAAPQPNSPPLNPHLRVPQARINARPEDYVERPFEEVAPFCVSANDLINPLPPSMFTGSGWEVFHPSAGSAELASHAHYWYSTLPTSKLRVSIQVGAGDVGIYYLKEPASRVGLGSTVECWVDDNFEGAVLIENSAQIAEPIPSLEMIDRHVSRGSHFVECELSGDEGERGVPPFKIIGVFSS